MGFPHAMLGGGSSSSSCGAFIHYRKRKGKTLLNLRQAFSFSTTKIVMKLHCLIDIG
jgi:hypothetical protein